MKLRPENLDVVLPNLSKEELGLLLERVGVELYARGEYEQAARCWALGWELAGLRLGEAHNPPRLYLGRYIPRDD
jgi:hypothetical protein